MEWGRILRLGKERAMKTLVCLLPAMMLFAPLSAVNAGSGWLIFHEKSFKGRVIDGETKEPIEGAVVVAQYHERVIGPAGSNSVVIDVQEALTDKKGEFFIPSLTTVIDPFSIGDDTSFLIWKPGYGHFPDDYSFAIFPVKNVNVVKSIKWDSNGNSTSIESEKINEGIVFRRKYKNWKFQERKDSRVLGGMIELNYPFSPLNNAESKLRNLDIPFDYAKDFGENPDDLYANKFWMVWRSSVPGPIEVYTVIGLTQMKTREERRMALPGPVDVERMWKKQQQFIEMIRKEWEYLYDEPAGKLYRTGEGK
jgi:hypothetical protein